MTQFVLLSALLFPMMAEPKQVPAMPPGEFFPVTAQDHRDASSFQRGQAIVGTTYFYWYDAATKAHIVDHDGSDALTTHPADLTGISFRSPAWHETQLTDMIDAGIDFLMPVFWGVPGKYDGWSFVGLPPLVEAHTALEKEGLQPPAIGLFYDTSILAWNGANADGSNYHVDLTTDLGREWFYLAIRDFFSLIPPAKWARVDGRPIIFLYDASFARKQDAQRQFVHAKSRFRQDFGVEPFIVKCAGWEGDTDAIYAWGGAVRGPIIFRETVSLGPGYDHSAVPGREPLIVERRDGRTYIDRWTKVLQLDPAARPWMVHVETWNEWHEGTDIAHSLEYGRSYIVLTRLFSDLWHTGTQLRFSWSYVNADAITWQVEKPAGLDVRPSSGDGVWEPRAFGDRQAVVSGPNPHSQTSRYLYFDVDDAFACGMVGKGAILLVTYRDAGCSSFAVEYDSTVDEGPLEGAFRPAGGMQVTGTGEWKTAQFRLADCQFMNRNNGADFRLAVFGGDVELAVSRVELRKDK
ncbi:MAG: DUF5010 domain-containing protein [Phycisphaerae bacterium]|nr:DUF5010 domain-containing protein [Phycisphaerae bacterium]